MPTVWIPALMRDLTGGQVTVEVDGTTVREVVQALESAYPGMAERLLDGGQLRPGIRAAVDGVVTRLGLRQPVPPHAEVHFLPAVSGGQLAPSPLGSGLG
jgi:molybdopterin converting factor small subunit